MELIIACFVAVVILFWLSVHTLKRLEEKNIVPVIKNPYTGKREFEMLFDFVRLYVFVGMGILFLFLTNLKIATGFLALSIFQLAWIHLQIKEHKKPKDKIEMIFNLEEQKEWEEYFNLRDDKIKYGKKNSIKKLVLVDDTIYFSKRSKIFLKEKLYHYLYVSSIEEKEKMIIFTYGFMGSPMFRRYIYVSSAKKDEFKKMLNGIQKIKKTSTNKWFT